MNEYELIFILKPSLSEKDRDSFVEKFKKFISDNKGKIEETNVWGKKRLAYEINKLRDGVYIFMRLKLGPKEVLSVDRKLRLDEAVLRYLLVKVE